ncbi:hypothetical protein [Microbacterium sp. Yaish 1]|uniref:hypothetical protein n=1 Tax=Microbacterium sp. Yaish 1 TaxID=2025014 RepID=UPI00117FDD6C|nr:hypothetical protein [Microbacterium sp. Yaish 1]
MTTDWPMFWVQVVVGLGTLALAWVSSSAARRAVESSRVANALSAKASEDAAAAHRRDAEKSEREQASKIWVSMIVITDSSRAGAPIHGVLLIRNSSDRPVSDIRILSRGWSSAKKQWFAKEECRIPVVYPGDTTVASRNSKTDWDVPEHYFPHFAADYNHAGGPRDDPYYVQSVEFTDADGRRWRLTSGHRLERAEPAS